MLGIKKYKKIFDPLSFLLSSRFTSVAAIPMNENESYLLFVTGSDALLR